MADGQTMSAPESERGLACIAYLFLWITGLIILLTAKKEEKYKRWHAIQAIALGIVVFVIGIVLNVLENILFQATGVPGGLSSIFGLLVIILVIFMMVKTYQGTTIRLPVVAGFADKNA